MSEPLLAVESLTKRYPITRHWWGGVARSTTAVDAVSCHIAVGETLALVGESGSGKTTTGRCILRLIEPDEGEIRYEGQDIRQLTPRAMRALRQRMQLVFQDPWTSLNPRMRVGDIIGEGIDVHRVARGSARDARVAALLEEVGLRPEAAQRWPHEFSGGQRQRIGIARALAVDPAFVVCDEAVSALDVSVQAQIINLLRDLQRQRGLSYLFISHDLAVVRHLAHRVAVMFAGRLVEIAPTAELFAAPQHPYTRALLDAIPRGVPGQRRPPLPLATVDATAAPTDAACRYYDRCANPRRDDQCRTVRPPLPQAAVRAAACHYPLSSAPT